jgi:hypothetical protein
MKFKQFLLEFPGVGMQSIRFIDDNGNRHGVNMEHTDLGWEHDKRLTGETRKDANGEQVPLTVGDKRQMSYIGNKKHAGAHNNHGVIVRGSSPTAGNFNHVLIRNYKHNPETGQQDDIEHRHPITPEDFKEARFTIANQKALLLRKGQKHLLPALTDTENNLNRREQALRARKAV